MFEWKDSYSLGIAGIDGQHHNLFRLARELQRELIAGRAQQAAEQALDRLAQYSVVHFAHEERLMRESGYPGYEEHRAEHEALSARLRDLQRDFAARREGVPLRLLQFVQVWLHKHTIVTDQEYAPYVSKANVSIL